MAGNKRSPQPYLDLVNGTLLLEIPLFCQLICTAWVEVGERRRGARRKASVRKEWLEPNTIDFSLSLYKSSKLNTCSPFLSLLSRLVFSFRGMFINLHKMSASPQQQTNEWCRISQLSVDLDQYNKKKKKIWNGKLILTARRWRCKQKNKTTKFQFV